MLSAWTLMVNGQPFDAQADKVDGDNYYKLRDLAAAFGFGVDYDGVTRTVNITASDHAAPAE